jgi:integrative and conjugative element protein (TIGR02256 family)
MRLLPQELSCVISYEIAQSDQRLVFSGEAMAQFSRWRQIGIGAAEAGGQLFAREDGDIVRVMEATAPRAGDRRWRFGFQPDRAAERAEILQRHSHGLHFVGDWHTHPEDIPTPSARDVQSTVDMFMRSTHHLNWMLLVIVGRREGPEGLFVGLGNRLGVAALNHVPSGSHAMAG